MSGLIELLLPRTRQPPSSLSKHKHEAWTYICIAHLMRCLGDRSFSFFVPLYLSRQCTSSALRPTAALSFVQNLAVVLLSTSAAKIYKRVSVSSSSSSSSFLYATILENTAVVFMGAFLHSFLQQSETSSSTAVDSSFSSCDDPLSSPSFRLALACGAVDAVSFKQIT